jgi:hypothetical protein
MMYLARELAGVGSGDPDMLNVYVLNWDRAIRRIHPPVAAWRWYDRARLRSSL